MKKDFRPSRKLGQNFLSDPAITARIAAAAELAPGELVLEIGPGKGILTRALLETGARVLAIEKDFRLHEELQQTFAKELEQAGTSVPPLEILRSDVLECDLPALLSERLGQGEKASVVANLPYSITGPAIFQLLETSHLLRRITIMLQKEVADRISAPPGSRTYGSISAAVALHGKAKFLFKVGRSAFKPQPRVDSAIVQIELSPRGSSEEMEQARQIIRAAFARRRKTLRNSLLESPLFRKMEDPAAAVDGALEKAHLNPQIRPEKLAAEDFLRLARAAFSE